MIEQTLTMETYNKIAQLVHSGKIEEVKTLMQTVPPSDTISATLQCLRAAVSYQNYEIVEHYIVQVPSETHTAHLLKMSVHARDYKMLGILLKNTPNRFTCAEALLEAIEYDDVPSVAQLFGLSTFASEPLRFLLHAGKHGSSKALLYLLNNATQEDDTMRVLVRQSLRPENLSFQQGGRILDLAMEHSSTNLLKKIATGCSKDSTNYYAQRLLAYCEVRFQHQAISHALNTQGVKTSPRKM